MYRCVIDSLGVALPVRSMSTRELIDGCAYPLKFPLERVTGIAARRVVAEGESALDLAESAARDCFERSTIAPGDVDLLIDGSISRHDGPYRFRFEPSAAAELRNRLGCGRAWTFDVTSACAGNFTAIYLAEALIRTGQIGTALVLCGEFITHLAGTAQKEIASDDDARIACLTLGDAGSAVLLTRSDEDRVGFEHIGIRTIGTYHTMCVAGPSEAPHGGAIMKTDTLPLSVAMIREAVTHTHSTLDRLGRSHCDIDHVIPHQTSLTAIEAARQQMNRAFSEPFLHEGNLINNLAEVGNTATTSHVLALRAGVLDGRIRSGGRVLFGIAGSGINVGTAVYALDDLPTLLAAGTRSTRLVPPATVPAAQSRQPVEVAGIGVTLPDDSADTSTLGLITQASTDCLRAADRTPSDVEMLIHAGLYRSGMVAEPAIAAIAAGELGFDGAATLSGEMLGFDLVNGGLGLFDACRVASALICCREVSNALVIASEVEERSPGTSQPRIARCGSALFLRADPDRRRGFLGFHTRHFDGGIGRFAAWGSNSDGRAVIHSDDRALLEEQYLKHLPLVVAELLEQTGIGPKSIRAVVPPSLSPPAVRRLHRQWPVLGERMVALPWPGRELFTSAMSFGLRRLHDEGAVASGDLVVLAGAGSGVQVGAALYRF